MKIDDILNVKIIDSDNIGNGIAKINNFVIFVSNALIDEELEIQIISVKKNYATAKIKNIIKRSKYRIEPICKYYDKCGGCNFLHTTYDYEVNVKKKYLEKLFNHKIEYIKSNNIYNYRNKVVLHIKNNKIGFYNDKTHDLCQIYECKLLNDSINKQISNLENIELNSINEIMIRSLDNKCMININGTTNLNNLQNVDSLYINNKKISGNDYLIDTIDNYKFSVYPLSFYQINKEGMINIYNKAKEYLGVGNTLLDLYCGTGTIGIWMNKDFKSITGVELNKTSIGNAKINLKLNNINNIKFICDDAKNINGKFDSIIVDPPRSGLSREVIDFLNKQNSKIVYISCNPNTLKRDINLLSNYKISKIACTDMFPRTKHVETVIVLDRR